jgi:hypothetical protein
MGVLRTVVATGTAMGASPKVMLAAVEAGLVESNLNNCSNGDRDSVGVFQQRPSWGTFAQRTDVAYASRSFLTKAIAREDRYSTSGRLAQAVQVSAFPYRYDTRATQAAQLIAAVAADPAGSAAGIGDGTFVSYRGSSYRIAGGAPIFVSDWSHLGGDPGSARTVSESEWGRLRQYPVDGTLLSGSSPGDPKHGSLYVVAAGAPVYRSSASGLEESSRAVVVDLTAITNAGRSGVWGHLNAPPASDEDAGPGPDGAAASQIPLAVGARSVAFPSRRVAVISWGASAGAKYYRVRITQPNSTKRWRTLVALTKPSARYGALRRGATYRIQITPVGPGGPGPTTTWKFRQLR